METKEITDNDKNEILARMAELSNLINEGGKITLQDEYKILFKEALKRGWITPNRG